MLVLTCPGCSKKLQVNEKSAGKKAKCPSCGHVVAIPKAVTTVPGSTSSAPLLPEAVFADTPKPSLEATGTGSSAPDEDTLALHHDQKSGSEEDGNQELFDFLAPRQNDQELGRLGPYSILKVLGSGGMGVVFEALDPHLERHIGLKVMKPSLAPSEAARKRFVREAKATAAIKHDHIVTIFQVGEERGVPYLAMEYLEGESLEDRLKREHVLPWAEALRIGREIAEGLAAAHERGLIHRDIKPGNIWLQGKRRRVKILDFGLARAIDDDTHLTRSGTIVGTPAYMAPEQAQSQPVDLRCDLFSLGAVLYRACTGQPPFKGQDTMSMLMSLAMDVPPTPKALNGQLPPAVSDLIMELLAKDRQQRPASAQKVVETIQTIENDRTVVLAIGPSAAENLELRAPLAGASVRRLPLIIGLAAAVLVAALLTFGALITFRTEHGTLVLNVPEPDVKVFIDGTEKLVVDSNKIGRVELIPGVHKLLVKRGTEELFTESFTLKSGGEIVIDAKWTPKVVATEKTEKVSPESWLKSVAALGADEQVKAVADKLKELNPGFDGKVTPKIEGGVVASLDFVSDHVTDISPVRALAGLTSLACYGSEVGKGKLADLSPLRGMKLTRLACTSTKVADLSPLEDMKLTELRCGITKVSDLSPLRNMKLISLNCNQTLVSSLSPLKDMKLTLLHCGGTKVADLSPLAGMKLKQLWCNLTPVSDLTPLKHMKLGQLHCGRTKVSDLTPLKDMKLNFLTFPSTPVSDLSPLKDMKLRRLSCEKTKVSDLSALKGMPLEQLNCDFKAERDAALLRSIKTLELINGKPARDFWKDVDSKRFDKKQPA
jgi:hypothetical protein